MARAGPGSRNIPDQSPATLLRLTVEVPFHMAQGFTMHARTVHFSSFHKSPAHLRVGLELTRKASPEAPRPHSTNWGRLTKLAVFDGGREPCSIC